MLVKLVKKTAHILVKRGIPFNESFENNKKVLGNTMPSKKLRNKMAGYLVKMKTQEKIKQMEYSNIAVKAE